MIINISKLYHPQDAVKLAYQAAFGAEHLLQDITKARAIFDEEYKRDPYPTPLVEEIAPNVVRVSLSAWREAKLPADWLFDLFVLSSGPRNENPKDLFCFYLDEFAALAKKGALPFSYTAWVDFMRCHNMYDEPRPVRHSEEYRKREKPAYRVVSGFFARLIPILYSLGGRQNAQIGIDGRAASGKSTMADGLARIFKTVPISLDDFFLPGELRTDKRLSEPGGNVHYERFAKEVIPYLHGEKSFSYRPFNCMTMDFDEQKVISTAPFMVIEGAYSHHPHFGEYLDIKVFSDVTHDLQMERLRQRSNNQIAEVFKTKWIPMEEKYFETYKIKERACLIV